jgi:hypothetical protein
MGGYPNQKNLDLKSLSWGLAQNFFNKPLMVISNAFAYCSGGYNDPEHEACIQREESNRVQKEMLELQRKQLEQ